MPSKVNCKMEKYILNQNNNNNRVVKPRPNLNQCKNESFQERSEDFDIGNMSQTMDTLLELGQRLAGKIEKENLTILRRPKVFSLNYRVSDLQRPVSFVFIQAPDSNFFCETSSTALSLNS